MFPKSRQMRPTLGVGVCDCSPEAEALVAGRGTEQWMSRSAG